MIEKLEIIAPFLLVFLLAMGWFIFESINKKTTFFVKVHWFIIAIIPFVVFAIIASIEVVYKVHFVIIISSAGSILCFLFGASASIISNQYKLKKEQKDEKIKELSQFGYKNNKDNAKKQKKIGD